jgi:hypothetical protein
MTDTPDSKFQPDSCCPGDEEFDVTGKVWRNEDGFVGVNFDYQDINFNVTISPDNYSTVLVRDSASEIDAMYPAFNSDGTQNGWVGNEWKPVPVDDSTKPTSVPRDPNPLILYVGVRTDLTSMGRGKGLAQSCHVGSLFARDHFIEPLRAKLKDPTAPDVDPMLWEWYDSEGNPDNPLGFGITLTLDLPDLETMSALVETARMLDFYAGPLTDPSYPFFVPNELVGRLDKSLFTLPPSSVGPKETVCFVEETTMCYILGRKSDLAILLGRYKLVPND